MKVKGLEKIILIAVFVVPIVICVLILKSIWAEDPVPVENEPEDKISVSISDEVVHPDDSFLSGDTENVLIGGTTNESGSSIETNSNRLEQISKLYTDAEIKAVLADVYTTTDVTSERIGTMEKYTKVTAQKYSGGWSQVTGIDSKGVNISGWIKTDNISYPNDGDLNVKPTSGTGIVTAEPYLNIRLSPSSDANKIGEVKKGERVTIEESVNGWHKVTVNGVTGWVSSDYIK